MWKENRKSKTVALITDY